MAGTILWFFFFPRVSMNSHPLDFLILSDLNGPQTKGRIVFKSLALQSFSVNADDVKSVFSN